MFSLLSFFFHERRGLSPQTSLRQMLLPGCRQLSTGSVVVTATCATTPLSYSTIQTTATVWCRDVNCKRHPTDGDYGSMVVVVISWDGFEPSATSFLSPREHRVEWNRIEDGAGRMGD